MPGGARSVVGLVEPVALERDPDRGEHLLHRGATDRPFRFAGVGFGALGEGVVAEGLPHLEHLAGAFASVVIGRHGLGGYRRATRPAPYDGAVLLAGGIIVAYLIGTFPTALMVGRRIGADPSREGSGNPGASNVYRLGGRRAGVLVAIVDMLKGGGHGRSHLAGHPPVPGWQGCRHRGRRRNRHRSDHRAGLCAALRARRQGRPGGSARVAVDRGGVSGGERDRRPAGLGSRRCGWCGRHSGHPPPVQHP